MMQLQKNFGSCYVERKDKSIHVDGNTYRKSIDVVPAFSISNHIENGIYLITDKEKERIYNYPLQHIKNGTEKNKNTGYKYKQYVRIFKYLKHYMEISNYQSAKNLGSFKIESLLWNVPDEYFTKYYNYGYGVNIIISYLVENKNKISYFKEANGIKKLCPEFIDQVKMNSFINDIKTFFVYDEV